MIAAVRIALGILGVLMLVVGTGFVRLGQHERHVARAEAIARDEHDRVERVRTASRRLYDAMDKPLAVFDMVGKARVRTVHEQVTLMHDAAQGMALARRDFLAAAGTYRDETHSDLGDQEKHLAHAEDVFIEAFVETRKMFATVALHPEMVTKFNGATDQLTSAMKDGISEYQGARAGIITEMRDELMADRARATVADRDAEHVRAQTSRAALANP